MTILLQIYFAINLFVAGYIFSDQFRWADSKLEKIKITFLTVIIILFGLLYIPYLLIENILLRFDNYFQIRFYLTFFFNKNYGKNLNESVLKSLNNLAKEKRNTNKLKDIIFRHNLKLINERRKKQN